MKTAEEWSEDNESGFCLESETTFDDHIKWIKAIQLDAWKQGMTDATQYKSLLTPHSAFIHDIIVERDKRKEI